MAKTPKTIPVYDIQNLGYTQPLQELVIAEPFAKYLEQHPNLYLPHRHSFYHIVFFTKGGGSHTIDFEQFKVQAGQIYFMTPGQVHGWSFDKHVDGFVINFSETLFRELVANEQYLEQFHFFRGIAKDGVINLPAKAAAMVQACMQHIIAETAAQAPYSKDVIAAKLIELFVTTERAGNVTTKNAPQPNLLLLQNFRKLLERYYTEKHLPKEYAAMLYVTPNHLNGLCKDLLGKPAGEIIRDRILLECKRLLVNADLSIAEIAYQLNFKDNSYFTKFFKKYTGITPEEFRKAAVRPAIKN